MCNIFRTLRPDEIEVRVQSTATSSKGKVYSQLLLYKNARVDMALLDETFGIFGWQREHSIRDGRNYCRLSLWDDEHGHWVVKEDVGVPSKMEELKGEASDAFKRAATTLGVGRELYSSPRIYILLAAGEYKDEGGKPKINPQLSFKVRGIEYDQLRNIVALDIIDNKGNVRFRMGAPRDMSEIAREEVNHCTTLTELKRIRAKYPDLVEDTRFRAAIEEKHQKVKQL